MKPKKLNSFDIILRADGNPQIGMGHVFRTLNLAFALRKKKYNILFLTTNTLVKTLIKKKGFECMLIPQKLSEQKKSLSNLSCDIFILDKKTEPSLILNQFKKISKVFFAIDYVGKNKNQIHFGINMLYPKSGSKTIFSDLKYSILSDGFKKSKKISKSVNSILVLQGGADTGCFIPKIINTLDKLERYFTITTVIGHSFSCWNELKVAKQNCHRKLNILKNITNMPIEMLKHDIAITAGGMTLLELSKCGIPCLIMGSEKQEKETALFLEKNGFGINVGFSKKFPDKRLIKQTNFLIQNYTLRKSMNKTGPKLVDGKGSIRTANLIVQFKSSLN